MTRAALQRGELAALLPKAPARSKACFSGESADFCPTLWVSGRVVLAGSASSFFVWVRGAVPSYNGTAKSN